MINKKSIKVTITEEWCSEKEMKEDHGWSTYLGTYYIEWADARYRSPIIMGWRPIYRSPMILFVFLPDELC